MSLSVRTGSPCRWFKAREAHYLGCGRAAVVCQLYSTTTVLPKHVRCNDGHTTVTDVALNSLAKCERRRWSIATAHLWQTAGPAACQSSRGICSRIAAHNATLGIYNARGLIRIHSVADFRATCYLVTLFATSRSETSATSYVHTLSVPSLQRSYLPSERTLRSRCQYVTLEMCCSNIRLTRIKAMHV